jgi:hypothetical protein
VTRSEILRRVVGVFDGSDGDATKALFADLEKRGPIGLIAVNLFRAQKNSGRAKVYRGRRYRDAAYDRKQWAMDNLCAVLAKHACDVGITWGWGADPKQSFHRFVLYVELPSGQVSFHTGERGEGPDYSSDWDGVTNASPGRVCSFVAQVLSCDPIEFPILLIAAAAPDAEQIAMAL